MNTNINIEQAWQHVLGQLQTDMPKASFETWVRDTKAVSFQEGVLTVSVRNAYARDWLKDRMTSTVNRLLVGVLNMSDASIKFVTEGEAGDGLIMDDASDGWRSREDGERKPAGLSSSKPEGEVEVALVDYDSAYEQLVRPNRAVYLPGYFRRWLRHLGPDLAWLYVAFRQAAYISGSRTGKVINRIPGDKIAALSGIAKRTFWYRFEDKKTWEKLKGLVEISDFGAEWDSESSTPKRLPRRYTISMTLPLTPVDSNSLSAWFVAHIEQHGGPEGVLRAAADAPLDELIPRDAKDEGDPVTVTALVHELFGGGELSKELLDSLASAIQNRVMPQGDLIVITEYFLRHILHHLGAGPGWMLILLRDMCFVDTASGESRNRVTVQGGYAEVAGWLGLSRPKTIWDWLNARDDKGNIKNPVLRVYVSEVVREKELNFEGAYRTFDLLIEETPRELLEASLTGRIGAICSIVLARFADPDGATCTIGMARFAQSDGATCSIVLARFAQDIGATCTELINSLTLKTNSLNSENTTTLNTSAEKRANRANDGKTVEEQGAVNFFLPSAWVLDRILILNRVHPKTQKTVRGASALALVSWLLYALSPQGHGIEKPLSYALARLKDDPKTGAGDAYDQLAKLPPAQLIEAVHKVSRGQLFREYHRHSEKPGPAVEMWLDVMGTNDLAARQLMRFLLGDQSPDIRQKIRSSEKIEFTEEGVEITTEESIEEI